MSLIRALSLFALGLAPLLPAAAGEVSLALKGQGAYFVLHLPQSVQSQTRAADLSDIQVLNARGEAMPSAWAHEEPSTETTERQQDVPFFDALRKAASGVDAAQRGGWILDTRAVQGARLRLELVLPPGARGIYSAALDGSDNLQQWHTVQPKVQLLSLQHRGQRLDHTVIDLEGVQARYLRLRPLPGSALLPLSRARVVSVTRQPVLQPLQWSAPITASECTTQSCDYPLPRHVPLERFDIQLAEVNTLARVQLLGRPDQEIEPAGAASRPSGHGMRQRLKQLRHKDRPAPHEPSVWWEPVAETLVYWLQLGDGDVRSQAAALPGGLYTHLRVQPGGGLTQLGARPPTLRVGSRPRSLIFLARGPAPYRLAWGATTPIPALALADLMPARRVGDPLPAATATVETPAAVQTPTAAASRPASSGMADVKPEASRVYWLWAVLAVALGLMGYMAWSLLKPSAKPSV